MTGGVDSEHPANLNSAVPACITKEYVPKVMPSYQAGHEAIVNTHSWHGGQHALVVWRVCDAVDAN